MKKILFVATVTSHINSFHIPYLKMFKEQGYEVHVASKGNENIEYCDKHFEIPFERFPLKSKNIKAYKQLKNIINENKYEIIHCHTPVGGVLTRLAARKARKKYGTKVIYTAHGFHFYKGAPLLNWIIYYPIEKFLARYTDCLIMITQEDYEFARRKIKAKRIEHVNGVGMNTDRFQKIDKDKVEQLRQEYKISSNDIVFSYIGELNENKNQILLIKTMEQIKKKYKNSKLLLVGDGVNKELYKYEIQRRDLEGNVYLLGRRKEINEILSLTTIYLAPSIREGLPVNVMEAMYKGLPIIATSNRGHRELIEDGVNGYIVQNNEDELTKKIDKLIENKDLRNKMKNESRNKSLKYRIEEIEKEMKKIYNLK